MQIASSVNKRIERDQTETDMPYSYHRVFDPNNTSVTGDRTRIRNAKDSSLGDVSDKSIYVYEEETILAVNVALATGRPLLVLGPPGSGKSSLARNVAHNLNRRYYEYVITSRTEALDLLWKYDALRRLNDAQAHQLRADAAYYIEPGVLWWALDPASASNIGRKGAADRQAPPAPDVDSAAVVLLDEIDKADPNLPDDLLVPLGAFRFTVPELDGREILVRHHPLVMITSNGERALSSAFIRRCVVHELKLHDEGKLVAIAKAHFGDKDTGLYRAVAKRVIEHRDDIQDPTSVPPSSAEFLDAIRACRELGIDPTQGGTILESLLNATIVKRN